MIRKKSLPRLYKPSKCCQFGWEGQILDEIEEKSNPGPAVLPEWQTALLVQSIAGWAERGLGQVLTRLKKKECTVCSIAGMADIIFDETNLIIWWVILLNARHSNYVGSTAAKTLREIQMRTVDVSQGYKSDAVWYGWGYHSDGAMGWKELVGTWLLSG